MYMYMYFHACTRISIFSISCTKNRSALIACPFPLYIHIHRPLYTGRSGPPLPILWPGIHLHLHQPDQETCCSQRGSCLLQTSCVHKHWLLLRPRSPFRKPTVLNSIIHVPTVQCMCIIMRIIHTHICTCTFVNTRSFVTASIQV